MDTVNTIKYRAFSEVASSVIHEMKNPLSAITLGMEYLQLNEAGAAKAEILTNISSAVIRLNEMLENLHLFFSEGNGTGKKSPLRISDALTKKLMNYYLAKNHVRLDIEESGKEPWVTGNEGQMMTLFFLATVWSVNRLNGDGILKWRCDGGEEGLQVKAELQRNGDAASFVLPPADDGQVAYALSKLISANGGQIVQPEGGDTATVVCFMFPTTGSR